MSLISILKSFAGAPTTPDEQPTPQMEAAAARVFAIFQEHQSNPAVVSAAALRNGMHPDEIAVRIADAAISLGLASVVHAPDVQAASAAVGGAVGGAS